MSKYTGWQEDLSNDLCEAMTPLAAEDFLAVLEARELGDYSKEAIAFIERLIDENTDIVERMELLKEDR